MSSPTIHEPPVRSSTSTPPAHAATSILIQDQIEIPLGITSLDDFRQWARSNDFPEQGRIDYINGRIEVDLMVENLFYHGVAKAEIARVIGGRVVSDKSGRWFIDRTRVSEASADLSAEPDLVFLSFDSITNKRVAYIPSKDGDPESFVEIEGSPDWVCELVSNSSEEKDTIRLSERYFAARVKEYWLVDARGNELRFAVLVRGDKEFVSQQPDTNGYQLSSVFQHRYRFTREKGPDGHWIYQLDEQPIG